MRKSTVVFGIGIFVAIGAVAAGLALVKRAQMRASAGSMGEPPMAVEVVDAKVIPYQPTSDVVGTVVALRSVTVSNEAEGVVRFVGFNSGDVVEPGQVLIRLDESTVRSELAAAQAALRVSEAEVKVIEARVKWAEVEVQRQSAANATGAAPAVDLDRANAELDRSRAEHQSALAKVVEARAKLDRVETLLAKHTITAPFRARVGIRTVHEGQFLSRPFGAPATPIAMLQEVSDTIYVDFAVPQEQLFRVAVGTKVVGVLDEGAADLPAGRSIVLTVAAVDAAASLDTRNVRVRTCVENKDQRLLPGMFVRVRVPIDVERRFVAVPNTAVRRASYGDHVWIVAPNKEGQPGFLAAQRFVKLGPIVGDSSIVLDGLREGERIAASGSFKLREGAPVMPGGRSDQPSPAAPGAATTNGTP